MGRSLRKLQFWNNSLFSCLLLYSFSKWREFDSNAAYVVCISICIWVFLIWYPYGLVSLYSNTDHCSGYGVAMGCYGLSIIQRTAIVTSQWYDHYYFTENARIWARHSTTPCNANVRRLHTVNIYFFSVGFNSICYTFLRNNPKHWGTQL